MMKKNHFPGYKWVIRILIVGLSLSLTLSLLPLESCLDSHNPIIPMQQGHQDTSDKTTPKQPIGQAENSKDNQEEQEKSFTDKLTISSEHPGDKTKAIQAQQPIDTKDQAHPTSINRQLGYSSASTPNSPITNKGTAQPGTATKRQQNAKIKIQQENLQAKQNQASKHREKKELYVNNEEEQDLEQKLLDKVFKLPQDYKVKFFKENGEWKANVKHFSKPLGVVLEPGMSLAGLLKLKESVYPNHIQIIKADRNTNKEAYVLVSKHTGLLGAGKRKRREEDKIGEKKEAQETKKSHKAVEQEISNTSSSSGQSSVEASSHADMPTKEYDADSEYEPHSKKTTKRKRKEKEKKEKKKRAKPSESEAPTPEEEAFFVNEGAPDAGEITAEAQKAEIIAAKKLRETIAAETEKAEIALTEAKEAETAKEAEEVAEAAREAARQAEKAVEELKKVVEESTKHAEGARQEEAEGMEEIGKIREALLEQLEEAKKAIERAKEIVTTAEQVVNRKRLVEKAEELAAAAEEKLAAVEQVEVTDEEVATVAAVAAAKEVVSLIETANRRSETAGTEDEEEKQTVQKVVVAAEKTLEAAVQIVQKTLVNLSKQAKEAKTAAEAAVKLKAETEAIAAVKVAEATAKSTIKILEAIKSIQKVIASKGSGLVEQAKGISLLVVDIEKTKEEVEAKEKEAKDIIKNRSTDQKEKRASEVAAKAAKKAEEAAKEIEEAETEIAQEAAKAKAAKAVAKAKEAAVKARTEAKAKAEAAKKAKEKAKAKEKVKEADKAEVDKVKAEAANAKAEADEAEAEADEAEAEADKAAEAVEEADKAPKQKKGDTLDKNYVLNSEKASSIGRELETLLKEYKNIIKTQKKNSAKDKELLEKCKEEIVKKLQVLLNEYKQLKAKQYNPNREKELLAKCKEAIATVYLNPGEELAKAIGRYTEAVFKQDEQREEAVLILQKFQVIYPEEFSLVKESEPLKKQIEELKVEAKRKDAKKAQQMLKMLRKSGLYDPTDQSTMDVYKKAIVEAINPEATAPEQYFNTFTARAARRLSYVIKANEGISDLGLMRLSDLIVMPVKATEAPEIIEWGGDYDSPEDANATNIFEPLFTSGDGKEYDDVVMTIDPSGKGKDEVAYCVARRSGDYYFIRAVGGMAGSYDKDRRANKKAVREKLISIALKHQVDTIYVENNMDFSLPILLKQDWEEKQKHPTKQSTESSKLKFIGYHEHREKEERIITTLQPLLKKHQLIMHRGALQADFTSQPQDDLNYKFFYQLMVVGEITAPNNKPRKYFDGKPPIHDDRVDAVANAIYFLRNKKEMIEKFEKEITSLKKIIEPDSKIESDSEKTLDTELHALQQLGEKYKTGIEGVKDSDDSEQAREYYEKYIETARANNLIPDAEVQFNLAQLYQQLVGETEKAKALSLCREAAKQGHSEALCELAKLTPGTKSMDMAYYYYKKAADNGSRAANYHLAVSYEDGSFSNVSGALRLGEDPTELAIYLYKKAAKDGYAVAQQELGDRYYYGLYVGQNFKKAFKWFLRAAKQGQVKAQSLTATLYYKGLGVSRNFKKAFKWYLRAAEQDDLAAQIGLADMYWKGHAVTTIDYTQARRWYKKAIEQKNIQATYKLGKMYQKLCRKASNLEKLDKHFNKAVKYYRQTYELEIAPEHEERTEHEKLRVESLFKLGEIWEEWGEEIEHREEAQDWYVRAAQKGHVKARQKIVLLYTSRKLNEANLNILGSNKEERKRIIKEWATDVRDKAKEKPKASPLKRVSHSKDTSSKSKGAMKNLESRDPRNKGKEKEIEESAEDTSNYGEGLEIRKGFEYDENSILIVWDSYVKKHQISYFIKVNKQNLSVLSLSTLFQAGNLTPQKRAGLLIDFLCN